VDAGFPALRPAYLWERASALLIDLVVCLWLGVFTVALEIDVATRLHVPTSTIGSVVALTAVFAVPLYVVWSWGGTGRTIGNVCLGIRVSWPDGRRLGPVKAAARAVCAVFSLAPAGLGLWIAAGPKKLAWHDRIAGTAVRRTHRRWQGSKWKAAAVVALAIAGLSVAIAGLPRQRNATATPTPPSAISPGARLNGQARIPND
jgi:uncharacterized RDD family membrane protein YckC